MSKVIFTPIARPQQQHQIVYSPEKEIKPMELDCNGLMGIILCIGVAFSLAIFTWKQ